MVGLVLGGVIALEAFAESRGHSLDPTDPMNFDVFSVRNDAAVTQYIHLCSDRSCARLDGHFTWLAVAPGAVVDQQVGWGSSQPASYAVADGPGDALSRRCLLLDASKRAVAKTDSPLSRSVSCPAIGQSP